MLPVLSAWYSWLVLAALLGPAEARTRRLYAASGSAGALAGSAVAAAGLHFWAQVASFAVVATLGMATRPVLLRPYLRAVARRGRQTGTAIAVDQVSHDGGRVRYGGAKWDARSLGPVIPPGTKLGVAGLLGGSVLHVYPKAAARQAVQAARSAPVKRVSWRAASSARGRLTGGYLLSPEERLRLMQVSDARWRYTDRLFRRGSIAFAAVSCAGLLAIGALGLGPAIRAARGEGERGVFTAVSLSCDRTCTWNGTFTVGATQVLSNASYDDKLPQGTEAADTFPALYPGGSNVVFAIHGSTTWVFYAVMMPIAAAGLVCSLWVGPVRYLRRRRNEQAAAGSGTPGDVTT
jgi:membrane protein implicated in regulation of membrane protease activity